MSVSKQFLSPGEDIKNLKQAKEHLLKANREITAILESITDGFVHQANDAFLSMLGYTRQDLEAGRLNWRALTPPEYQEASTQAVKEVRTGGAAHLYEKAYLAKNSKRVPVLVGSVVFRRTGSKQLAISFVLDLTAQKAAEEEQREADQRIKAILESITDAFSHVDTAWRYTYVNCGLEKLMGKKREEIVGRSLWEVVPEVVATPFEDAYRQAMETQQATHVEGFHPTFQCWLEISIYPTPDGLSFYLHDITDRKEIERQKDLFLGMTGHELKTPLAALRGRSCISFGFRWKPRSFDRKNGRIALLLGATLPGAFLLFWKTGQSRLLDQMVDQLQQIVFVQRDGCSLSSIAMNVLSRWQLAGKGGDAVSQQLG